MGYQQKSSLYIYHDFQDLNGIWIVDVLHLQFPRAPHALRTPHYLLTQTYAFQSFICLGGYPFVVGCFVDRGLNQFHESFLVFEDDKLGIIDYISDYCGYFGSYLDYITQIGDGRLYFKQVELIGLNLAELFRMIRLFMREKCVFIGRFVVNTIIGNVCADCHLFPTHLTQCFYESQRQLKGHLVKSFFALLGHLRNHKVYSFLGDPDLCCPFFGETNGYFGILVVITKKLRCWSNILEKPSSRRGCQGIDGQRDFFRFFLKFHQRGFH